jgi:hypothetical protein
MMKTGLDEALDEFSIVKIPGDLQPLDNQINGGGVSACPEKLLLQFASREGSTGERFQRNSVELFP